MLLAIFVPHSSGAHTKERRRTSRVREAYASSARSQADLGYFDLDTGLLKMKLSLDDAVADTVLSGLLL